MNNETFAQEMQRRCEAVEREILMRYGAQDPFAALAMIGAGLKVLVALGRPRDYVMEGVTMMLDGLLDSLKPSVDQVAQGRDTLST